MLRTISPLDPIFFAPSPKPERKNGELMMVHNIHYQPYHHNGEITEIVSPKVGCVLSKTGKRTGIIEKYAVVETSCKTRGVNRGIIDRIRLQPIFDIEANQMLVGKTDIPYILKLTNHGNWWDKNSTRQYDFAWCSFLLNPLRIDFRPIKRML